MRVFFSLCTLTVLGVSSGALDLLWVPRNFLSLITAATAFSLVLSAYLYATSFVPGRKLAEHGCSGNPVYDFFMGR
jgi:hypothetical protein